MLWKAFETFGFCCGLNSLLSLARGFERFWEGLIFLSMKKLDTFTFGINNYADRATRLWGFSNGGLST